MLLQTAANLGILVLNCYFLLKSSHDFTNTKSLTLQKKLFYIFIQTLTGLLLLNFATVSEGIRIDFRFVFYAVSIKYLGWQITTPVMFLVTISRFLFPYNDSAIVASCFSLLLMMTLPFVDSWLSKKVDEFRHLFVLISYGLMTSLLAIFLIFDDFKKATYLAILLVGYTYLLTFILYGLMSEFRNMVVLVHTDYLTNLYNKKSFEDDLEHLSKQNDPFSLIVLDIDFFKTVNDQFGHHVGDMVLKEVAERFQVFIESSRKLYRVGGEEFAIIMSGTNQEETVELACSIQEEIEDMTIKLENDQHVRVTISAGIAIQEENEHLKTTFYRADSALYHSKNNGRNKISIAEATECQSLPSIP